MVICYAPLDILQERFARGEIDKEEFEELMAAPTAISPLKRTLIKAAASLGHRFTLPELVEATLGREMTDEELNRLYLLTEEAEGHA